MVILLWLSADVADSAEEGCKGKVSRSIAQCNRTLAINLLIRHMFGFNNRKATPHAYGEMVMHIHII
jgi:hypothetical protein